MEHLQHLPNNIEQPANTIPNIILHDVGKK